LESANFLQHTQASIYRIYFCRLDQETEGAASLYPHTVSTSTAEQLKKMQGYFKIVNPDDLKRWITYWKAIVAQDSSLPG